MHLLVLIILSTTCSNAQECGGLPGIPSRIWDEIDDFAMDFIRYQMNTTPWKNIFFSPYAIVSTYTMLRDFAVGKTQDDIQKVMAKADYSRGEMDEWMMMAFNSFPDDLKRREKDFQYPNLLALSNKIKLKWQFEDFVKLWYHTEILPTNFTNSKDTRDKINEWVQNKTSGNIVKFLQAAPSKDTVMSDFNAVFFQPRWKLRFNDFFTGTFKFSYKPFQKAVMMRVKTQDDKPLIFCSNREGDFQAAEVPLENELSMYILSTFRYGIPIEKMLNQLDARRLRSVFANLKPRKVASMYMPFFEIHSDYELDKILPEMGMKVPFSDEADFSGISDTKLKISKSFHKGSFRMNIFRSINSAASGRKPVSSRSKRSIRWQNEIVQIYYPFLFLIRDKLQGVTVFAGVVNNPPIPNGTNFQID